MIIGVAGPYSAPTAELKQMNMDAMNRAAVEVLRKGHTPIIGMNAALPVVQMAGLADPYEATMKISMAVINACEAILMIGSSPARTKRKNWCKAKACPSIIA